MSEFVSDHQREAIAVLCAVHTTHTGMQQALLFFKSLGIPQQHVARLLDEAQPSISQYANGRRPGKTILMRLYTILEKDFPERLAFDWQNRAKEHVMKEVEKQILGT